MPRTRSNESRCGCDSHKTGDSAGAEADGGPFLFEAVVLCRRAWLVRIWVGDK